MTLSGKEKRQLKAMGQIMADDARVGKEGLSAGFLATVRERLRRKDGCRCGVNLAVTRKGG